MNKAGNLQNAFDKQPNEILEAILTFLEYKNAVRFRMTSKGYYGGLRMTVTEEHRNTIELNWRGIYNCGGMDYVKRILAQDGKIDPSNGLYDAACYRISLRYQFGIPEDKSTELFYFLRRDRKSTR